MDEEISVSVITLSCLLAFYLLSLVLLLINSRHPVVKYRIPSLLTIQTLFNAILLYVAWGNSLLVSETTQDSLIPCFLARLLFFVALPTVEIVFLIRVWTLGLFYQSFQRLLYHNGMANTAATNQSPEPMPSPAARPRFFSARSRSAEPTNDHASSRRSSVAGPSLGKAPSIRRPATNLLVPVILHNGSISVVQSPSMSNNPSTPISERYMLTTVDQPQHDKVFEINMKILRFFLAIERRLSCYSFVTKSSSSMKQQDDAEEQSSSVHDETRLQNAFFRINGGVMLIMLALILILETILFLVMTFISSTRFIDMQVQNCDKNDYLILFIFTLFFLILCWICTYYGLRGIVDSLGIRRELTTTCAAMTVSFVFIIVQRILYYFVYNSPSDRNWNFGTPLFAMSLLLQILSVSEPLYVLYLSKLVWFMKSRLLDFRSRRQANPAALKGESSIPSTVELLKTHTNLKVLAAIVNDPALAKDMKDFMMRQLCLENLAYLQCIESFCKKLKKGQDLDAELEPFMLPNNGSLSSNQWADAIHFGENISRQFLNSQGHQPELNLPQDLVSRFKAHLSKASHRDPNANDHDERGNLFDDVNSITKEVCKMIIQNSLRPFLQGNEKSRLRASQILTQ